MSTIAFDQLYIDATLLSGAGVNGVTSNNIISYTQPIVPLASMNPQTLVPAGAVLTALNTLQTQITNLQNQVDNIPAATQNVNIIPAAEPDQFYLRANYNNLQFNILTVTSKTSC